MKKAFYSWLLQFKSDNTPLGDLARDAKEDKEFPRHSTSYKNIKAHLDFNSASIDALEIFERAFVRYKEEMQMDS
ncbi:MAG: sterile alpha motif-like domain-containing protein [Paludibacteraceae bacterium]|nr:sterile alpha motif-like domain-containing protein [Paludibacteraceae bacterium]MBR0498875.1 sterile alpha motif-like domain-containing protein [Paludibacteraceae bacterium]